MQDVQRADFLDRPIIEPEPARLAAPHARVKPDRIEPGAVEQEGEFLPVAGDRQIEAARRQRAFAGQHRNLESVHRLQTLRFRPQAHPVTATGLDPQLLRHPAVAVRIGGEVLQANRRLAAVLHFRVGKTDHARLVVESVSLELMAGELLEPAVEEVHGFNRHKLRPPLPDDKWSVFDRHSLRQVAVVRQRRAAVTDGKHGRNEFEPVSFAGQLHGIEPAEEIRVSPAQGVQLPREHGPVAAVPRRRVEHLGHIGHIGVLVQIPAEHPDKAVGIGRPGLRGRGRRRRGPKDWAGRGQTGQSEDAHGEPCACRQREKAASSLHHPKLHPAGRRSSMFFCFLD